MRRLIVNADDFGLTSGVNRAIIEGNRSGIVTSATLMANARASDAAIDLAMAQPSLKTGCHVVLIDGVPLAENLPSLTNDAPLFRTNLKQFAIAAVRKQIDAEEIQREVEAQICKIQSRGITLTHVDSHKHTHMFPHVLRPLLRAAKACGVRAVRNPFEPARSWPAGIVLRTPGLWLRSAGVMAFQMFAAEFRRALNEEGMVSTDGTVGIAVTGMLDQQKLLRILAALPEGTWELVCHPGYSDADLQAAGTRLTQSREVELSALTSAEIRKVLAHHQIELISYADL
ncbi:MAG TPA: ChbG/HpnK family deacetylase [Candidatus Dormibacteraeota bacterium]|nr:ChbG/HpnK family deacetylase [Candidatus Dormibacteraeota bacterium]